MQRLRVGVLSACFVVLAASFSGKALEESVAAPAPSPDFVLTRDQTHTKFSRLIKPVVRVPSGSVIEALTHECTGGQLNLNWTVEDAAKVDVDRIHTLNGPVYVEGANPGDVLAARLLELEPVDWGWHDAHAEAHLRGCQVRGLDQ